MIFFFKSCFGLNGGVHHSRQERKRSHKTQTHVFPLVHAQKVRSDPRLKGKRQLPGLMPFGRMQWRRGHLRFYWFVLLGKSLGGHLRQGRTPPPPFIEGQELGTVWNLLSRGSMTVGSLSFHLWERSVCLVWVFLSRFLFFCNFFSFFVLSYKHLKKRVCFLSFVWCSEGIVFNEI